jgi:hypothetical protein
MPNTNQYIRIDLKRVSARNDTAHRIITGLRSATPTLAEVWQYLDSALDDLILLSTEVTRLANQVHLTRLDRANLLAAGLATIHAHHDSEVDPLSYLRDEIVAQTSGAQERR